MNRMTSLTFLASFCIAYTMNANYAESFSALGNAAEDGYKNTMMKGAFVKLLDDEKAAAIGGFIGMKDASLAGINKINAIKDLRDQLEQEIAKDPKAEFNNLMTTGVGGDLVKATGATFTAG